MWWVSVGWACSVLAPAPWEVVSDPTDVQPPEPFEVGGVDITRGHGPVDGAMSSCDDLGFIHVSLTHPEPVGVRIVAVEGLLPEGMSLDVAAEATEWLQLLWVDGRTDEQEPFDFVVGLAPVDRAGNEGPRVDVEIAHEGSGTGGTGGTGSGAVGSKGCAVAPSGGAWLLWCGLWMRRRR